MANTLDSMDLKQIITLHIDGYSNRKIGKTLGISRNTINNYISLFTASRYRPKELLAKSEGELKELFTSTTTIDNSRYNALMCFFEKINQSRGHPGFTFQFHYREYFHK